MPLQWRNQVWQSLEEGAGKRCSECDRGHVGRRLNLLGAQCRSRVKPVLYWAKCLFAEHTSDSSTNYDSFLY